MTHKLSLNSLVLDFKRDNEGKGVQGSQALTALVAFTLAYSVRLPDNGAYGSTEAAQAFLVPIMKNIVSDVNELYCVDLGTVLDLTSALYCNRYDNVWGGKRALDAFSPKAVIDEAYGVDCYPTVQLWAERFFETVGFYISETTQKA
ncbi:hypothetical protein pEaSNUABM42_00062 [Erwinia phage pEa_SNUABM_42]|nr:hypothetical protein pEaSNUABM43_00062 [Erwinia phage pEa_SNUABM_43]QVW55379.1 hypothetical protein pEaSNUABM42_00062 [Erwinia phage pEa_SNUABM_42]